MGMDRIRAFPQAVVYFSKGYTLAALVRNRDLIEVVQHAGKAMYEGIIVELPLAAFFLKKLRGGSSDLNDLPSLDRQLYGNLMKLTDPNLDLESVGVHFTIISTASGEECEVPLIPGKLLKRLPNAY